MKYYSVLRPIGLGVLTSAVKEKTVCIKNYEYPEYVAAINREAYGYIETENALTEKEISDCELKPEYQEKTEKEKRIAVAYILADCGYTKKEAYTEAMQISIDEINAILEEE